MKNVSIALAGVLVLVASTSAFARSPLGGFMGSNGCYNGSFVADRVCVAVDSRGEGWVGNNKIEIIAKAEARYLPVSGSGPGAPSSQERVGDRVRVDVAIALEDHNNFFQPEATVPVIVRGLSCKARLECRLGISRSVSLILDRKEGTRTLAGARLSFELHNAFGAEYTETLEKLEVLVPGVNGIITVNF